MRLFGKFFRILVIISFLTATLFLITHSPKFVLAAVAYPNFGAIPQFRDKWVEQDGLVGRLGVERPYTWGPNVIGVPPGLYEPYKGSPYGVRRVFYLDKARMEITDPTKGFVTTGLIVKELVSGKRQDGDDFFRKFEPSQTQVAGDPVEVNPDGPTYASFKDLVTLGETDSHSQLPAIGLVVTNFLSKAGNISMFDPPQKITIGAYEVKTGHNIATQFQDFKYTRGPVTDPKTGQTKLNELLFTADPTSNVFGLAISEPYWVNTKVAGKDQFILVQLFERRVLTYNPSLSNNKVEMGNLGQHYYRWRCVENNCRDNVVVDAEKPVPDVFNFEKCWINTESNNLAFQPNTPAITIRKMQSKDNTYLVQTVKDCPPKEYFPEQEYEATLITQQRTSKPVFALTFEVKFDNKIRYWLLTPTITSDGDLMVEVFRIHSNEDFRGTEFNITFKPK